MKRLCRGLAVLAVAASTWVACAATPAQASVRAYYLTFHLAGANEHHVGGVKASARVHAFSRLLAVNDLLRSIDRLHPQGIAVQEFCRSTDRSITDAFEYLDREAFARGYVLYAKETTRLPTLHCKQHAGVIARRLSRVEQSYLVLPKDGHDPRVVVCQEVFGYVKVTTCSTHLTAHGTQAQRAAQSKAARGFARDLDTHDLDEVGGDFNEDHQTRGSGQTFSTWYDQFSEGDRFLDRDTAGRRKIDYLFGRSAFMHAVPGAGVVSTPHSDHRLLWAPYDWL